jgi:hypothetical protein
LTFKTKVQYVGVNRSFRVNIPIRLIKYLDLKQGDMINWEPNMIEDDKPISITIWKDNIEYKKDVDRRTNQKST